VLAVHGQADQQRLTRPSEQRALLDRFAGADLSGYTAAYERWRAAADRLAQRTSRARELQREADLLQHGLSEIGAVAPRPEEDAELSAAARRLAQVDALRLAARAAHDTLLGDPDDPSSDADDVAGLLGRAQRSMAQVSGDDPELDALASRLAEIGAQAVDVGRELADYEAQLDADPARLAEIEHRRARLTSLVRRYGSDDLPGVAGVLDWAEQAAARLDELDVSDSALAALAEDRDKAAAEAGALADELSQIRSAAAERLGRAVSVELAALAMAGAALTVEVRRRRASDAQPALSVAGVPAGAGPDGVDDVEILLAAHPGAPPLPVARGASGGELSRVMLALEVSLAGTDPVPTMVFDEVDAGVGGRAATEVGARLARLAQRHQVVVVTHLAQVAAFADQHVVVTKPATADGAGGGVTRSDVRAVDGAQRVAELARMLGGNDSAAARRHASELLRAARLNRTEAEERNSS
jgi:DNA repair protein RecN (Recombination protein N)